MLRNFLEWWCSFGNFHDFVNVYVGFHELGKPVEQTLKLFLLFVCGNQAEVSVRDYDVFSPRNDSNHLYLCKLFCSEPRFHRVSLAPDSVQNHTFNPHFGVESFVAVNKRGNSSRHPFHVGYEHDRTLQNLADFRCAALLVRSVMGVVKSHRALYNRYVCVSEVSLKRLNYVHSG